MSDADRCICCGEIIPEGRHICQSCADRIGKAKDIVVHCEECYYRISGIEDDQVKCVDGQWNDRDWFGADGKRRDAE